MFSVGRSFITSWCFKILLVYFILRTKFYPTQTTGLLVQKINEQEVFGWSFDRMFSVMKVRAARELVWGNNKLGNWPCRIAPQSMACWSIF